MSVLNPRNRLVNFRLSEEEFERLKGACGQFGSRSISDFARSSVLDRIASGDGNEAKPQQFNELNLKVNALEGRMTQLMGLIEATGHSVPFQMNEVRPEGRAVEAGAAHG